ncbi:hypothetical protein N431DRAFT_154862 [Stipitochalara longipes BDJ]|nr:hypothetical protein N431DRAFT_154862 [Stipitochalara longipes BDJ]
MGPHPPGWQQSGQVSSCRGASPPKRRAISGDTAQVQSDAHEVKHEQSLHRNKQLLLWTWTSSLPRGATSFKIQNTIEPSKRRRGRHRSLIPTSSCGSQGGLSATRQGPRRRTIAIYMPHSQPAEPGWWAAAAAARRAIEGHRAIIGPRYSPKRGWELGAWAEGCARSSLWSSLRSSSRKSFLRAPPARTTESVRTARAFAMEQAGQDASCRMQHFYPLPCSLCSLCSLSHKCPQVPTTARLPDSLDCNHSATLPLCHTSPAMAATEGDAPMDPMRCPWSICAEGR